MDRTFFQASEKYPDLRMATALMKNTVTTLMKNADEKSPAEKGTISALSAKRLSGHGLSVKYA